MSKVRLKQILTILTTGLGLFAVGQGINHVPDYHVTAQASTNEQRLTRRVDRFAPGRQVDHYRQLNWNARDLGGYKTANHKYMVRRDRLIRGGNLTDLSRAGARKMRWLHVNHIVDLRADYEIRRNPDPGEAGYRGRIRLNIPVKHYQTMTNYGKSETQPAKRRYGEIYHYGWPFITTKTAIHSYRNLFNLALHNRHGAIYFHCIQGRDRTGVASALLLKALGVSRYTIYNDFLLTNYYKPKYSYTYQCQELNRFFATIRARYGSTNNYLNRIVGMNRTKINRLRRMYLIRIR